MWFFTVKFAWNTTAARPNATNTTSAPSVGSRAVLAIATSVDVPLWKKNNEKPIKSLSIKGSMTKEKSLKILHSVYAVPGKNLPLKYAVIAKKPTSSTTTFKLVKTAAKCTTGSVETSMPLKIWASFFSKGRNYHTARNFFRAHCASKKLVTSAA